MSSRESTFVVIGAGQAGGRAVKALRESGYDGILHLIGAEPHLPYERPALSKALLLDPAAKLPMMYPSAFFEENKISVATGRAARAIDRIRHKIILDNDDELSYDRVLLATGSRVRQLTLSGCAAEDIFYLRTLEDAHALEQRIAAQSNIVIVGAGFIGLEAAASAAARGCKVTVLEAADRVLARAGSPEASAYVLAYHRERGLDIRLAARIEYFENGRIFLGDGSSVAADVIVAGIGVLPETALAQAAGLRVDDGIVTDECGRTSDPDIFAAGDVTRQFHPALGRHVRLESWENANLQADAAARTMAGVPTSVSEVPWLWSDQGDLNLQFAGAPQNVDRVILRGENVSEGGISIFQFQDNRLVGGITINRARDMPIIRRMLAQRDVFYPLEQISNEAVPLRQLATQRKTA